MIEAILILFSINPIFLLVSAYLHIACIRWAVRNRKRHPVPIWTLSAIYAGSYALLSLNGEYVLANHGGNDWTLSWCPAYVIQEAYAIPEWKIVRPKIRATPLAAVYLPLLALDRAVIHPAKEPWAGYYDLYREKSE